MSPDIFPDGFRAAQADVDGTRINYVIGGDGPPVLLLHGYPQTHAMWHHVAPGLAADHTVIAADLRGYGDSAKPAPSHGDANYSKRAMAADQRGLMASLGHDTFDLVGHDRGARVSHRLALDFPAAVRRLAVLDIVPTHHVFTHVDRAMAMAYYHWFFLTQGGGLPERLIGAEPGFWLNSCLSGLSNGTSPFDTRAQAEYGRCFSDPATIAASCADYRAAAGIDMTHDQEDVDAGHRVDCPTLILWGAKGFVGKHYEVLNIWRTYATNADGHDLPAGHFVAEEAPGETTAALRQFLA